MGWKLKIGNFLFKFRSFTPVPLIIIVFLFFRPQVSNESALVLPATGLIFIIFGEIIRAVSVGFSFSGTSGRENFLRADNLNLTGIYSIVRNPLYIGNLFMYTGLLIAYSNIYALIFFDLLLILQYYFIILSEEEFLLGSYGDEYLNYKKKVRSVIPGFGSFKRSENNFSLLKVIFKENDTVFNALVIFGIILLYKGYIISGKFVNGKFYVVYFGALIISYILIKIFKRRLF